MKKLLLTLFWGIALWPACQAQVKEQVRFSIPDVLSSNMVLQQGQTVPVWGTASPGERVKVIFGKRRLTTRADNEGKWKVMLPAMTADKASHTLTIEAKDTTVVLDNVAIGEVWLCAGQSNMEYRMKLLPQFAPPKKGTDLAAEELKKPANEMIRVFLPSRRGKSGWRVADGESLPNVSAAGYFFGKKIQEELDVPVGIITTAVGGTRIEAWTPKEAYENGRFPIFANILKENNGMIQGVRPGDMYNRLLRPIIPYGIKGFLWYQGENNCAIDDRDYARKFQLMTERWRQDFGLPEAPFYYVLLASHIYSDRMHRNAKGPVTAETLPLFRQSQINAKEQIPNSEYIVVNDLVDDLRDIHPSYKWEVGARLARVALAKSYGRDSILWSGPRVKSWEKREQEIIITFDHCGEGLKTSDDKLLSWFELASGKNDFRPALAEIISKDQVRVYGYFTPTQVRLGWHETAIPNLTNSEGLPVTPFFLNDF